MARLVVMDERINQAAQLFADEVIRLKETPADLWGRYLTNTLEIPEAVKDVGFEVVIRALDILEGRQS
jgi:hypothetical protein